MNDKEVADAAFHIGSIFPTVNPAMIHAIKQELSRGKYSVDKVMTWANWRRAETSAFSLDDLRNAFIADQPKTESPLAGRDVYRLRQKEECDQQTERNKRIEAEINELDDATLADLKQQALATIDPKIRPMYDKDPRKCLPLMLEIERMLRGKVEGVKA